MQIPTKINTFNQQLEDYKMKHENQRLSHTSIPNTKKQTCSEPTKGVNKRPGCKVIPSLEQQLKDYRRIHNSQRLISTTSHQPNNRINNISVSGQNQHHANRRKHNNMSTPSLLSPIPPTNHPLNNKGYIVDHPDKPPTLHFHDQLKQYREKQQISFFKTTPGRDATLSNTTQNKDDNSRQRLNALKHSTNLYPFRIHRRIIPSYRTVHRHQSLEWLAHLDKVTSLTRRQ